MPVEPGTRIGPYVVLAPLGAGGMGEVWRARDSRLGRDVAIKTLPTELARDPKLLGRLKREARLLASLRHPGITTIHGLEEIDGQRYLVLECVEGPTLAERLERGPLPLKEALEVCRQIAAAMEAAHESGVIHRDLKPANVKLVPGGEVKVLDFGIGKAALPPGLASEATRSRTVTVEATDPGAILGTAPYMSPEQALGQVVDRRTDIWSFGCVLYECLSGRQTFGGQGFSATVARVLEREPEWSVLPEETPARVRALLRQCLVKNPKERLRDMGDARLELERVIRGREEVGGEVGALAAAGSDAAGAVGLAKSAAPRRSSRLLRRTWVIGLVVAVAALAGFLLFRDRLRPSSRGIESVAVLPLENLTGDASQEYFADGMTEELINDLSRISALRVPSRTSIMRYKKTTKSLPEIAKELGVAAIVEGSVSRSGTQVKITAQLIDASKDQHMWADTFQRDLKDVLTLQSEVARAIAEKIQIRLKPEEATRLASSRTVNPEAYEAYLKGRYHWYRRTPADAIKSRDFFQQAVDEDPNYAAGWAGLAAAYHLLSSTPYSMMAPRDGYPKVLEACRKAISLDPNNAEAHAMRGFVRFFFDRDAKAAESDFRRSQELDPRYAQGHQLYSFMLQSLGRFEEAIREAKTGRDDEPLSLVQNANVAYTFHFSGRYDEAIEWCKRTLDMDANFLRAHYVLGMAYERKKMYSEAITELEAARRISEDGPHYVASLGHAYAAAGRTADARRCLEDLNGMARRRFVGSEQIGLVHVGLGERGAALTLLERGEEERNNWMMNLAIDRRFDPLRSDPRFDDLLKRLHLK